MIYLSIKLFLNHLPFLLTSGLLFDLDKIAAIQKNTQKDNNHWLHKKTSAQGTPHTHSTLAFIFAKKSSSLEVCKHTLFPNEP